jgi:hypothetical protein
VNQEQASPGLKALFFATGLAAAITAAGYVTQQHWALSSWPWADGRLSNIFVGSILAAVALPMLWIGWSGQFAAAAGGFLHLGVLLGGAASVLFSLAVTRGGGSMLAWAAGAAAAALACFVLARWAHRLPARDRRPITRTMRAWFVLYVLILVPGGVALLWHVPGVMPWPLKPESSSVYGWILLSAVCSFVYPLLRPHVEYVYVGLLGFLAYDLVLLPPFVRHFGAVPPAFHTTLVVYTSVLALTAAISLWYLLISPHTRVAGVPPG